MYIYHKDFLPRKVNNINCLKECLSLIYRSQSQSSEEFDTFLSNFEFILYHIANRNPYVSIIIGDFNVMSNSWCSSDNTTYEGKKLESLT